MKIKRENITLKLNAEEVEILEKAKDLLNNIADNMVWGEYIGYESTETLTDAADTIKEIINHSEAEED